jgi:21S rRNA (GM2251-2'-O)-methyltransferase
MSVLARIPLRSCLPSVIFAGCRVTIPSIASRHASLASAIGKGIYKSRAFDSASRKRIFSRGGRSSRIRSRKDGVPAATSTPRLFQPRFGDDDIIEKGNFSREHRRKSVSPGRRASQGDLSHPAEPKQGDDASRTPTPEQKGFHKGKGKKGSQDVRHKGMRPDRVKEHVKVPPSVPYTTPASEFIYGTSVVEAAIRCTRRQLYKLYIYQSAAEDLSPAKVAIRKLALSRGLQVKIASGGWDQLLDKMSAGRPHNGCVLEASPLPKLPVISFERVEPPMAGHYFSVTRGSQSREEAVVNGINNRIFLTTNLNQSSPGADSTTDRELLQLPSRSPFVLLLDGILDPGNLGAIIRSAYYLGVDAIAFAARNSAPLSPVAIKASAGATESMTLLAVQNEVEFIRRSRANGWRFYAADAPGIINKARPFLVPQGNHYQRSEVSLDTPTVLMLGSEGTGLSSRLKAQADALVSIPGARIGLQDTPQEMAADPARVDSLNVSVAAAILMEMFLQTRLAIREASPEIRPGGREKNAETIVQWSPPPHRAFTFN